MSTSKPPPSPRAALGALALALSALLGACGPGVGGTGTGEGISALPQFDASPASLCGSELAALVGCPSGSAAATPGSAAVYLADTIDGRRVLVRLQGNEIELDAPCARLQFRGQWGTIANQASRFFGYATLDGAPALATVSAQIGGGGVQLTLRDAQGTTLIGPVLVVVVPAPATPGGCN
jgi:hypothetical protein